MTHYIGEFRCKLDEKGRLSLPAKMRAQIQEDSIHALVINRGFDRCLVLYTKEDWMVESVKLEALDDYTSEDVRRFKRILTAGATVVQPDGAQRVLIPKSLAEFAGITENVVVSGRGSKFEIWDSKLYDEMWQVDEQEMSRLAKVYQTKVTEIKKL